MIRAALLALAVAGCASMPAPSCPPQNITAVICPEPMEDYYDQAFRRELSDDLSAFPEYAALSRAARSWLAIAKRCQRTL